MDKFSILTFFITNNVIFSLCYDNNKKDKQHVDNNNNNNNNNNNKDDSENEKNDLQKLIEESVKNTVVIKEEKRLGEVKTKNNNCQVEMKKGKTIDSALYYIKNNPNNKVCILNFANWLSPGGNQEGSIRNATTINNNLACKTSKEDFYDKHDSKDQDKANDDIIYSPDVIILQDDSKNKLSDFNNKIDVISCAAPNKSGKINDETILKLQNQRMQKILDVADKYDVDILILGAFGCGVFKNPADKLANEYSKILKDKIKNYKSKFKKIVFAIPDDVNYNHFNKVFNNFTFE